MALKSSRCSDESYIEPVLCWKKEFRSSVIKIVDSSLNSSLMPVDSICSIPASEDGFNLSKRRKMDEECDHLLTNGNMRDGSTTNFTTIGYISSPEHNTDGQSCMVNSNAEFSAGSRSNVNNGQPSSSSSAPSYISQSIRNAWECSLPDTNTAKPVTELTSARDLCISILICPAKDSELSRTSSTIDCDDNLISPLFECMKCGLMEDPSKMLICDCCEGAFHLLCCNPRVKKIPEEEWYCLACKKKKPKRQRGKLTNPKVKSSKDIERPRRGLGPIREMLVDSESYESDVRIGSKFQAEVPEWSGPISSREDQFAEPTELDPSKTTTLGCLEQFEDKKTTIGNWIQCREVLDTGVICGKWRRAPLFVVQSSDWDCSCSVVWDPFHADCAVPQELETAEVREQLKYINKLKSRLGDSNQKR
ncbi:hypothetical protein BDA96_10G282200 [Sorghum bicolor]|uniref:PHD-type domain-containing protein n=2 Tax=Sorghum bicolor TaxID=4558 RepID=A0A194YKQ2_SORBI|nr:histone acetyltransferase KAT6B [Sorghum bicolor]XP_021305099.1 histone acetyltransferase KAT6B [Sorghum bicolor]KAG0515477.1 hypothetical protein BDA96_10G282200 [Sorghum bicolor]KXG20532.1 hypothetical protein SORBI_3010G217600 [Sorghum bicolor]KXG20533.1 hypothetical protein SORBI_3010G217600 [Sorghum bicolor]|eukprot:XP_002437408.2 histone acetyltransferase KAT6B [Sorghum bicolor]